MIKEFNNLKKLLIFGIAGMPGAGKTEVCKILSKKFNAPIYIMGDIIRRIAKERNIEPTRNNLEKIMLKIREEEGEDIIAKKIFEEIKLSNIKNGVIIIDGIRSIHELDFFKKNFENFILLAVIASKENRFLRLFKRRREDDPSSFEEFIKRDRIESLIGLGAVLAEADFYILNDGTLKELNKQIQKISSIISKKSRC
ncbi:MAG: AAA family ATPase [Nitrososphaerota archaeon]